MATTASMQENEDEYSAAFNEDAPAAVEQSEDEAFGLSPEKVVAEESKGEAVADPAADTGEDAAPGMSSAPVDVAVVIDAGEMTEAAEKEGAKESAVEAADQAVDISKETQRLKSWEGRLKAMEAKLKAAGADTKEEQAEAVGNAIEKAGEQADTPAEEEMVEQIAEQVESGEITPEQAMKQLSEDFGDDFVRMIEAIAVAKAKEAGGQAAADKVGELGKTVDDIISDIVDNKARIHFEKIADAHPDFNEIGESDEFKAYIDSLPEDEKTAAVQTVADGSAKQIIKLLNDYKAAAPAAPAGDMDAADMPDEQMAAAPVDQSGAMDAAEGVRSSGMKLPEQPQQAGYEQAWKDF